MAELHHVFESNKPKKGGRIDITLRGNQMFLCSEHPNIWIELRVSNAEKTNLMKALMKDFLGV